MTDTFAVPDDTEPLRASELHSSLGERLGAQAGEALFGTTRAITRNVEYETARGNAWPGLNMPEDPSIEDIAGLAQYKGQTPDVPIADAQSRIKQEGLERHVKLPEQSSIKQSVLDLMVEHGHEQRQVEAAVQRGPQGFFPDALGFITEMGVGLIDPLNIAAFSIPGPGFGGLMARAGESLAGRASARLAAGAAQGAIGGAALVPEDWWLHTNDGRDYTMADALRSVVMTAGMGGAFHAAGGAIGDMMARRAGVPLEGSPAELLQRGLMRGTHLEGPALAEKPAKPAPTQDEVPGVAAADGAPSATAITETPPPEPPPVPSGFEADHASPHDFDRFDLSRLNTGEGAQIYGHGLYFSEASGVHEHYLKQFTARTVDGQEFDPKNPVHWAAGALKMEGSRDKAEKLLESKLIDLSEEAAEQAKQGIALLKSGAALPDAETARSYRVRIAADKSHLLDWDKPFAEQPPKVREALARFKLEDGQRYGEPVPVDALEGREIYDQIVAQAGGKGEASAALHQAGIPGVRYLDEESRARPIQFASLTPEENEEFRHIGYGRAADVTYQMERKSPAQAWEKNIRHWLSLIGPGERRDLLQKLVDSKDFTPVKPADTHNFVVFDDKLVEIARKNDTPFAAVQAAIADLPPKVKEDFHRMAIADVTQGNAVRVGEAFEESAKGDKRIAESMALAKPAGEAPAAGLDKAPDWQRVADAKRGPDEELLQASRDADRLPEPPSVAASDTAGAAGQASKRTVAAQAAEAEAAALYKWQRELGTISEEEATRFDDALRLLDRDFEARADVIRQAVPCLLGAGFEAAV